MSDLFKKNYNYIYQIETVFLRVSLGSSLWITLFTEHNITRDIHARRGELRAPIEVTYGDSGEERERITNERASERLASPQGKTSFSCTHLAIREI